MPDPQEMTNAAIEKIMEGQIKAAQGEKVKSLEDMAELLGTSVSPTLKPGKTVSEEAAQHETDWLEIRGKNVPLPPRADTKSRVEAITILSLFSLNNPEVDKVLSYGDFWWNDPDKGKTYLIDPPKKSVELAPKAAQEEETKKNLILDKPELDEEKLKKGDILKVSRADSSTYLVVYEGPGPKPDLYTVCILMENNSHSVHKDHTTWFCHGDQLIEMVRQFQKPGKQTS